ncbi:MAG: Xaa-Pro aminopeptidase [Planctomycetota bacterium]|nr:Xaa-Pro aminopeptidase [Planctomycetota bacterium]MCX8040184.1 Xaa-Pro aminopeptidase [Planctomycetota bacterium]
MPLLVVGCDEPELRRDRQDPWFAWLTGCQEPDAALLLDPARRPSDTLFLDPGDPARAIWDGARLPPNEQARELFGAGAIAHRQTLEDRVHLAARRAGGVLAMCHRSREPGFQARAYEAWRQRLAPAIAVLNAEPHLAPLRAVKDAHELASIRRAIARTAAGLRAVLREVPRLQRESEIAALLHFHYRKDDYAPLAFPPIVGSGKQAAILHYPHNDQPLADGKPVLIDSGATADGYCADVTRTVPRSGQFSERRLREIYELVLAANQRVRQQARPGITFDELNDLAWKPLIGAGYERHHGIGHFLGLDVHDVGDRRQPLAPGMVITNEPGIYLADEGIGVRIEDDLLITRDGCAELTREIPKDLAGLEAWMRG